MMQEQILQSHHIKLGLEIKEDDHTLVVFDNGRPTRLRYSTTGLMSKDIIRLDCDDYLAEQRRRLRRGPVGVYHG